MRGLALSLVLAACAGDGTDALDTLCGDDGVITQYWTVGEECAGHPLEATPYGAEHHAQRCRAYVAPLLAADAVIVDETAVAYCRAALVTASCTTETFKDWRHNTRMCGDALRGVITAGEPCSSHTECEPSLYCHGDAGDLCGSCEAKLADGAACSYAAMCRSGMCEAGRCAATNLPAGAACRSDLQCSGDLLCRQGSCAASTIGSSCANDGECSVYRASCSDSNTCEPLVGLNEVCEAWGGTGAAPKCRWMDGIGCLSGRCQTMPDAGVGGRCGYDIARCAAGLDCEAGVCQRPAAEGDACSADTDCTADAWCVEGACAFSLYEPVCHPSAEDDDGLPL